MKPLITWEKWKDQFGADDDLPDRFDSDNDLYNDCYTEINEELQSKPTKVIVTPMGLVPYTENTDSSKIFKFWVGHANFDITHDIVFIIEQTEGVETLDVYTRYRFRISVGKSFNDRDIMSNINSNIYKYLGENDESTNHSL